MLETTNARQDSEVHKKFNDVSGEYAGWYAAETSQAHSFQIRRQRVYEMIVGAPVGRALDIGCGPGVTMDHLLRTGYEVWGVDISEGMIAECKKRHGENPKLHFAVGRIEKLAFPDAHFDLLICMGVVEYLDDDEAAIREMARVTKPGGVIIITCPNAWSPWRLWSRVYWGAKNPVKKLLGRPLYNQIFHREYTQKNYSKLLHQNGLEITDVCYYNFKILLEPLSRWFPNATIALSRKLEGHCRSPLRWLGTGFIVKAVKSRS